MVKDSMDRRSVILFRDFPLEARIRAIRSPLPAREMASRGKVSNDGAGYDRVV